MNYKFRDIALRLQGPRGVGRTRAMLQAAPIGTVIMCANEAHATDIRRRALDEGRGDLRMYVPRDIGVQHVPGDHVWFDNHTLECLFFEADAELAKREAENGQLQKQVDNQVQTIKSLLSKNDDLKWEMSRITDQREYLVQQLAGLANKTPPAPIYMTVNPEKSDVYRDAAIKLKDGLIAKLEDTVAQLKAEVERLKTKPVKVLICLADDNGPATSVEFAELKR